MKTKPLPVPEVGERRAANKVASRQAELDALIKVAAKFNLFTSDDVVRFTRAAILAAENAVTAAKNGL